MLCTVCGTARAKAQTCPGDGSDHHHGGIHAKRGGEVEAKTGPGHAFLCDRCILIAWEEWFPGEKFDQVPAQPWHRVRDRVGTRRRATTA